MVILRVHSDLRMKMHITFRLWSALMPTIPDQVGLVGRLYSSNPHEGCDFAFGEGVFSTNPKRETVVLDPLLAFIRRGKLVPRTYTGCKLHGDQCRIE